jgi:prepilin-type N-terminal cleavage/methylation domain-containing protein
MIRMREEDGLTLIEMLVAMTLMLIVMFATLTSFDAFGRRQTINNKQTDAVERLRFVSERVAKQMRNLASPTNNSGDTIERAEGDDIIFQTYEPQKRRVRYCLPNGSTDERLYFMTQNPNADGSTKALPTTNSCAPNTGGGWDRVQVVGENVVNNRSGAPVFTYNWDQAAASSNAYGKITAIRLLMITDVNSSSARPNAVRVASGIDLRNQNQAPTAAFRVTGGGAGNHTFILNGSGSSDPEGRSLTYFWYRGRTAGFTPTAADLIGDSKIFNYTVPNGDIGSGIWYFKLEVRDPGNLSSFCPLNGSGVSSNCSSTAQSF